MDHLMTRRTLLTTGAVTGAAVLTAACQPSPGGNPATSPSARSLSLPTYAPFDSVKPDLPGDASGVSPAYFSFPNPPVDRPGFPLPKSAPATALLQGGPPKLVPAKNPAYQEMFAQIGTTIDTVNVTSSQYRDKFAVTMAGGDIPDFVQMIKVAQLPKLLEKNFTDLTEFIGGDNVKKYPGLANIPTSTWRIPVVGGRLWGISQPRPPAGRILSTRGDLLSQRGIDASPTLKNGEDFLALLRELTDKKAGVFALGSDPSGWLLPGVLEMMGAPNEWRIQDGKFTSSLESPEMEAALEACRKIVSEGLVHPNSFSDPGKNRSWWQAGTTSLYFQAFTGWGVYARENPAWNVGYVRLPRWNGGGTSNVFRSVSGYPDFIAIRKQDNPARVEELLRIADYMASPFGTSQFLTTNYGHLGTTYTMKDGNPQLVAGANTSLIVGWYYCGGNSQAVLFTPGQEALVRAQHSYLTEVMPNSVANPAEGLYSETDATKGASYLSRIADTQRAVMRGTTDMDAWRTLIKSWKSEVGNKIAEEFAQEAAQR